MNNKIADIQTQNVTYGEQGWRSTETTRPPAMWPGFGLYVIAYNICRVQSGWQNQQSKQILMTVELPGKFII